MKKGIIALAALCLAAFGSMSAQAERGEVVLVTRDKILVVTDEGYYTGGEVYGLAYVQSGDVVHGEFEEYGIQEWYDEDTGEDFEVYVINYWMTEGDALYWLRR